MMNQRNKAKREIKKYNLLVRQTILLKTNKILINHKILVPYLNHLIISLTFFKLFSNKRDNYQEILLSYGL